MATQLLLSQMYWEKKSAWALLLQCLNAQKEASQLDNARARGQPSILLITRRLSLYAARSSASPVLWFPSDLHLKYSAVGR